jgi:hypothetical protein
VVLVDCGGNPGSGAVESAVQRVRPGGTLVLRTRGAPCVGWLNIDKPLTILGEGGFSVRDWADRPAAPMLQAPDGLPCITVAPGVRVTVRDVVFAAPRAGEAACVVGYGAEIVLHSVGIQYAGRDVAVLAEGGLLDIRESRITADTAAPAILADRAALTTDDLHVLGARSGIEIVPGSPAGVTLSRTRIWGPNSGERSGARTTGILVGGGRDFGRVQVNRTTVCGFDDGVSVEGAGVSVRQSRLCKLDTGVVVYSGSIDLADSRVSRADTGVLMGLGSGTVVGNVFAGVRDVVRGNSNGVEISGNHVWSRQDSLCRPQMVRRYRDRYSPHWDDRGGYACETSPYPQDWWRQDEGAFGVAYEDYAYRLPEYDRYQQGYGWYDCGGRYVSDDRYRGDERWSRGGWGRDGDCRRRSSGPERAYLAEREPYRDYDRGSDWGY